MVYKKYIKRNGKTYGPYLYHNTKKNGRVITTYHGKSRREKPKNKKLIFAIIFLSVLIVALSVNLFFLLKLSFTGKVSVDIKDVYNDGENIQGDLNLILQHGEFFPADTNVVIDNPGEIFEYPLSELVSETSYPGNFYVAGFDLNSSGEGYGVSGEAEVYPEVTFSFRIVETSGNETPFGVASSGSSGEIIKPENETVLENKTETKDNQTDIVSESNENSTAEPENKSSSDEGTSEESGEETDVVVPEESKTTTDETTSDETQDTPPSDSTASEESTKSGSVPSETSSETTSDDSSSTDSVSESSSESSSLESVSDSGGNSGAITGEIIGGDEDLIVGKVRAGEKFVYDLEPGQKIEVVYTTAPVDVSYEEGKAIVTTDYSEIQEGFGADYLTDETYVLPISFSNLDLAAREGTLKVSFVYSGVEILSTQKEIIVLNETENVTTPIFNETNATNFTRAQQIDNVLKNKGFKVDKKVQTQLLQKDFVRVILKLKDGQVSRGKKLGNSNYGVVDLDLATLQSLGSEVEGIVVDEPVELFLEDSEKIIRSVDVRDEFGLRGDGKSVCVVDSGVDPGVVSYIGGFDFVDEDSVPDDLNGHGTQVANVIKTIAPGVSLYVAKVIDENGVGYESDVLAGIDWCMQQGVDVISLSLGAGSYSGYCDSNFVSELSNSAVDSGIFVVAATGNDGATTIKAPSCASGVFRVSSTTKSDSIASFSNVNDIVDVFAPGENILTKTIGGSEIGVSGTSMSAPMVAASAALVLENESLNAENLKYRFRTTGIPISYEDMFIPRIDSYNAVINNFTFDPGNYTANQSEANDTNASVIYNPLTQTYRISGSPYWVMDGTTTGYRCMQIEDDLQINEKAIDYGEARVNASRWISTPMVYVMVCDSNSQNCTLSSGFAPPYDTWNMSSYYNMSVSPNYTVSDAHGDTYDIHLCTRGGGGSYSKVNISWVELHVIGLNCSDDLDGNQEICEVCGKTWFPNSNGGAYGSCCGDDTATQDTWDNGTLACCGGTVMGKTQNEFCNVNSQWVDQGEGFCNTTDMREIYFQGLNTANDELICSGDITPATGCGINEANKNYLCENNNSIDGIIDGICGFKQGTLGGFGCIGFGLNETNTGFFYDDYSQDIIAMCDTDINESGFIAEGVTALNSSGVEDCAGLQVCQDDSSKTNYYDNCDLCDLDFSVDPNGDSCDSSVSDGSYSADGMCVRFGSSSAICLPSASGKEVVINSAGEFFVDFFASPNTCNSTSLSGGELCDSNGGTQFNANGICASDGSSRNCESGLICNDSAGDFYDNCSLCGADSQCDSNVAISGYVPGSGEFCAITDGNSKCCPTGAGSCVNSYGTCFADSVATCSDYTGTDYCSYQVCSSGDFGSNVSCNGAKCSAGSCTTICSPFCGGDAACVDVNYATEVCTDDQADYCTSSCQALDRDSSESYCTSSAGQCNSSFGWSNVTSPTGFAPCCGDDGDNDDWDAGNYGGTSIDKNACYNGNEILEGDVSGSLYNYRGNLYDCGNNVSDAQNVDTNVLNCAHYGSYYCNASTYTWVAESPLGCSCSTGDDCATGLCVEQSCRNSCDGFIGMVNECSNNSAEWDSYGICTATETGTICDNFEATTGGLPLEYLHDCENSESTYGRRCDNGSLAGGYTGNGVCGGIAHANCYSDYAASNQTLINSYSIFGTEAQVCGNFSTNGWMCDDISNGGFSGLFSRCDVNDSYCDSCSLITPNLGEDGMCEEVCGADLECDELSAGSCIGTTGYCDLSCGYDFDADTSKGVCDCNLTSTGCNGASCFNSGWFFEAGTGSCCGDDINEFYSNSLYGRAIYSGCCDNVNDCVGPDGGSGTQCYSNGTILDNSICEDGEWSFAPMPVVESLVLAPSTAYTKDNLNCTVNVTDADTTNLNLTIAWYKNSGNLFNDSIVDYSEGTLFVSNLSHDYTHHGDSVYCGVFVTDGISDVTNFSNSVGVGNYPTSVSVSNENDTSIDLVEHFTADYNSGMFGDIGENLWESQDIGNAVYAVAFYECGESAKCFAVGTRTGSSSTQLYFYNSTGDVINSVINMYHVRDIKPYDFDGDGLDEVVVARGFSGQPGIYVFDTDGTELWNSGAVIYIGYITFGDVDSDGNTDIIAGQAYGNNLYVFNYTGTELFSYNAGGNWAYRGLAFGNFSDDGKILFGKNGGAYGVVNSTGGEVWRVATTAGDVNTINLDGDSYDEALIGRQLSAYDDDGSFLWSIGAFADNNNYEIAIADIDNDGTEEIVYGDGRYILAYNADSSSYNQEWNFSVENDTLYYSVMSLVLEDISDDDLDEVVFGGADDVAFVLDSSGTSKYNFSVFGDIGIADNPSLSSGRHPAIDVGDFNGDGVRDILVGSADHHAYIFQAADCNIMFNDSVSGNMVWNNANSKWDYVRSFDSSGNYTYNVTCYKGAYQTSVDYGSIFVEPNTAPNTTFVELNSSLGTNTSAENLNCYASVFDPDSGSAKDLYINYIWYNGSSVFSSGQAGAFNSGVVSLVSNLPSVNTNHFENWTCSVKGYDGAVYESDWNNASLYIINSLPVASNLVLNSTSGNNATSDNLTIYSTLSDVDLSDSVSSANDWRINDTSFAVLNMPFNTKVDGLGGIVKDYTTYENNATLGSGSFGTAPTWTSAGKVGGAYDFDGNNDAIVLDDSESLNISGNLTVSAWVYSEDNTAAMRIVSKHGPSLSGDLGWTFSTVNTNNRLIFRISSDGIVYDGSVTTPTNSFFSNTWQHVVAKYDGSYLRVYVNGVRVGTPQSYSNGINVASGPVVIGGDAFFSGSFFNGIIDDVMIFDKALSDAQIRELYLSGAANHSLEEITSDNLETGQNWTVAITPSDGFVDGETVMSNWLLIENNPPVVTLLAPANDSQITNRIPTFNWSGFDSEGDPLTYEINISLIGSSTCSDPDRDVGSLSNEYYTVATPLNCLYDNNDYYIWTVRASDDGGSTWGDWAEPWIVKIQSLVSINLTNNLVDFGVVLPEDINDTEDNNPPPFTLENIGNVRVNVSVNATNLWNSVLNPTNYFQYKIDNSTELGSFDWFLSQTSWAQVPSTNSPQTAIVDFNWIDSNDDAQVDLNISVPPNEGAGTRTSTIQFEASLAE